MRKKDRFALIGAAGYIAPKHMQAIYACEGELVAALDKSDSVGILDSYFPNAHFFTEFERFDRHIDKLRRKDEGVDFVSICSPNYLHDAHIRFALKSGADAICEKPLVLNPWNLDALSEIEQECGQKIYTILQLRLHPTIIALKNSTDRSKKAKVKLTYITSRGRWYFHSWKGEISKSGGIATNIGIHFFDMLIWIYGSVKRSELRIHKEEKVGGFLELEGASIEWFLSVDYNDLPPQVVAKGQRTYRKIEVDDKEVEFSEGFTSLHTLSYKEILRGCGFGIEESRQSIELAHCIRNSKIY